MARSSPPASALHVLCFGDSLTSGYYHFGLDSHPYSLRLAERLADAFPRRRVHVETDGLPGDVVSFPRFARRLRDACDKHFYDWVIVLGGTNDLSCGMGQEVFHKLKAAWGIPISKGSQVLALTVPPLNTHAPWAARARDDLNAQILAHQLPNFHVFDLKARLDLLAASPGEDIDKYYDDGVHFSPLGYDFIGERVAECLVPLIGEVAHGQTGPDTRAKTAHSQEREADNPSDSQE